MAKRIDTYTKPTLSRPSRGHRLRICTVSTLVTAVCFEENKQKNNLEVQLRCTYVTALTASFETGPVLPRESSSIQAFELRDHCLPEQPFFSAGDVLLCGRETLHRLRKQSRKRRQRNGHLAKLGRRTLTNATKASQQFFGCLATPTKRRQASLLLSETTSVALQLNPRSPLQLDPRDDK